MQLAEGHVLETVELGQWNSLLLFLPLERQLIIELVNRETMLALGEVVVDEDRFVVSEKLIVVLRGEDDDVINFGIPPIRHAENSTAEKQVN